MRINFETILGLFLGVFGLMFGSDATITRVVFAFLIIIAFDILTGVIKAMSKKDLNSSKWIDGFFRKLMMILCVSFCYYLDKFKILNAGVSLESATAMFFIAGEIISVLENFLEMGISLPQPLTDFLTKNAPSSMNTISSAQIVQAVQTVKKPIENMLVVDRSKLEDSTNGK